MCSTGTKVDIKGILQGSGKIVAVVLSRQTWEADNDCNEVNIHAKQAVEIQELRKNQGHGENNSNLCD